MKKQLHIIAFLLAFVASGAHAQQTGTNGQQNKQELHQEITLQKEFVPVEKKATKKNTLPTVKKAAAPAHTNVSFSDWAKPIDVPTTIPTMMPYGYRTAHNFSNKRGYLDLGGGMAANFVGSAGYRIIDRENLTLGAWMQHASTWTAKNSTKLISNDALRQKQKFNDNAFGVDLMSRMRGGTLNVGARVHFDSFNYYGGNDPTTGHHYAPFDSTQMFSEFGVLGAWEGIATLSDHELSYNVGANFNHAGYDKARPYGNFASGDKENLLNVTLGAEYAINEQTSVGLELQGDYVNHRNADYLLSDGVTRVTRGTDDYFLTTISPYFGWENHAVRVRLGADMVLGNLNMRKFQDVSHDEAAIYGDKQSGARFHVSPNVQFDATFTDGAAFYVDLGGGKTLNTLSDLAAQNRYSDPNAIYRFNSFSPFDGEAGFKIGPFAGFSMKVFGGYGIFLGDLNAVLTNYRVMTEMGEELVRHRMAFSPYATFKFRGFKIGGELNYKYRSLVDAKASLVYTPSDDDIYPNAWNKGYSLDGFDGACLLANLDIKVTPIRQLQLDLGLQVRGMRSQIVQFPASIESWNTESVSLNEYDYFDLDDMYNLHAGASWKFDKTLTLWVKGNNLLNRRYDVLAGMGAQKFNIMGGFALVF